MRGLQNVICRKLLMIMIIGAVPIISFSQDEKIAAVTGTYVIQNVNIIQAPGRKIDLGAILIKDGIIQSVGKTVVIPPDAKIIKADSMYVYAGFIDGMSHTGVKMPKKEDDKKETEDPGNPPNDLAGIEPYRDVRFFLDPTDKSVESYRQLGFTTAHVVPEGGMLPGKGAIILLSGKTSDEMVYREDYSLFSQLVGGPNVYPNTVIGVMAKYRDLYRNAQNSKSYSNRYKNDGVGMERPKSDRILEAFYPVIDKRQYVAFKAEEILDIHRVLTLQNDLGFNLMLGDLKQGWDAADKIKSSGTKVFLSLDLPEWKEKEEEKAESDTVKTEEKKEKPKTAKDIEQEQLEKRKEEMLAKYYQQPVVFNAKGIKFGFSTLEAKSKDVKGNLTKLVKKGLSEDAILAALTTNPADLLGLSATMGTVDNGKIANLVISDKPYFTDDAKVKMVFVDGILFEYEDKPKKKKSDGEDVNPVGSWSFSTDTPQGTGTGTVTITGEPGDYEGEMTITFSPEPLKLSNIEISGSEMSFSFQINADGSMLSVEVVVEIDDDTFEGTMTAGQFGSFPIEGEKNPE